MFSYSSLFFLADLDCFFVEVERLHRPELRGQPVIIGGRPDARGIVSSCSYEARRLGVHSAMPMGEAYRLAPRAIFLHEGLHGSYGLYSRRVRDILAAEVPLFKSKSFDEFELNLCGCSAWLEREHGGPERFAQHLRERVRREIGLKLSIGIAPSPLLAKLASRSAKPDGVFYLRPEQVQDYLAPLPVEAVSGIGEVTGQRLRDRGVESVGQLLGLPRALVRQHFGNGLLQIVDALQGHLPVNLDPQASGEQRPEARSIGHELTFERDQIDPQLLRGQLWELCEKACRRLRQAGLRASRATLQVRYSDFKTLSQVQAFDEPLDNEAEAFPALLELFGSLCSRRLRVRHLGLRFSRFSAGSQQLALFAGAARQKDERLFGALDRLRDKYGRSAVLLGPGISGLRQAS
ncbi:DNA polymerase IV [bacterium]|nr:DNA polymerase IV [bacterium]